MRLRRSRLAGECITRRRRGRGFAYHHDDGSPVTDAATVDRIRALAIPPAWRDVWICPWPNGHIQATGTDDAGRKQYLYHAQWREDRDRAKFERVRKLARKLPAFRREVATDVTSRGLAKQRVTGVALRMLEQGVFRVGNDEYVESNGTYGVSTLLREHVTVRRDRVEFRFPAKGQKERRVALSDPELAKAVTSLKRSRTGSDRLLMYRSGREWRPLDAQDVNERLHELVGDDYTVKDLRTWNATVLAAVILAGSTGGKRVAVREMFKEVAHHLGNTPAIARKSYVDPRVVDAFEEDRTIRPSTDLERVERAVARLLGRVDAD
ncbi:DNA topoisomerase IB [Kutzneria buriramensis]|uniref:DNA topoisomerase n=1 Tax=Kutzneria buriramensis TaxID=1045776 RepID=A0A3E0H7A3_9PSEU|nr:DNA topoisomerase IB [Kutzneria buriramensis]REH39315.1 DNA topoisomerase IB [Kutzneria buriramensis]